MVGRSKKIALSIVLLLFSSAFAGIAAGGSRYPLTVVLWNEDADFHPVGSNFTAWAQVYVGDQPTDATTVTFRFGLDVPPVAPWVNYAGVSGGAPGLYRATINVTAFDTFIGLSQLAVIVSLNGDSALNYRLVLTNSTTAFSGGPVAPISTVQAGVDNLAELGPTIEPGESITWRIETKAFGVNADAPSLTADLFIDPDVDFSEAPIALTPTPVGTGAYEVYYTVPSNWVVGQQLILQVTTNEANFAQNNISADVWFYDTVAHFEVLDGSQLKGSLTVGDGRAVRPGVAVDLTFSDLGDPSHVIGTIGSNTNPAGQVAFNIANDGTLAVAVRGWINGTFSQFVSQNLFLPIPFTPQQPDNSRFDAIALEDISLIPWNGTQTLSYEFWANGSLWANMPVNAFASSSRGQFLAANLTTGASGQADLTVDFDAVPFALDDQINGGINLTFRAPIGFNNGSSDGLWWGEDEEIATPDANLQTLEAVADTAITFSTTQFSLGSPLGVGAKYTGAADVTGFKGVSFLFPGTFIDLVLGNTLMDAIWTGHDTPFASYLMDGDDQEFFGTVWAPSYWPNVTYSVLTALAPSTGAVGGDAGPPRTPIGWVEVTPGGASASFAQLNDTTPPEVYGPSDMTVDAGTTVALRTQAYDNTIDFYETGNYTWSLTCGDGNFVLYGNPAPFTPAIPGDCAVDLNVTDANGHSTVRSFVITALDVLAPVVDAGLGFSAVAGELVWLNGTVSDDDLLFPAGGTIEWSFAYNGSTITMPGPIANFTFWALGNYTATLRATDGANNSANDTVTFTILSPDTVEPIADTGFDFSVVAGVPVDFNGTATDNDPAFPTGAQFNWSFVYNGTPQEFAGANFTFTFWVPGTYVLTLSARDAWGNVGTDLLTLTVTRPDTTAPVVNAGLDQTVDAGTSVTLSGSATDNDPAFPTGAQFWWLFTVAPTPYNLSGASTTFVFNQPGAFTITLWVQDAWGNIGTDTVVITVRPRDTTAPTVQPVADATILIGTTQTFTAVATDNAANFSTAGNYSWSFTVGATPVTLYGNNASYTFATAGDFVVTLRVKDGSGNTGTLRTFTIHVFVPDVTPPQVQASPSSSTVEVGTSVTFTGAATDGGNPLTNDSAFTWTFTYNGSVQTLTGRTASFVFGAAGNYTVTLRVQDAAGNNATSSFTVAVTDKPAPPPPTTAGPGFELYAIIGLLAAVAVIAALVMRGRKKSPPPAARAPSAAPPKAPQPSDSDTLDDLDRM